MHKDMLFSDEARKSIFNGVQKLARAVKATLGPTGRNVVIKKNNAAPFITKDGVTVANEVDLEDEFENIGAQLVREVASKTSSAAGDGTTTATVLAEAILSVGARHLSSGVNATELKKGIDGAVKVALNYITEQSVSISSKEEMRQVATISSNGDEHIGVLLSDLIDEIGADGVATLEKSGTAETFVERVDGLQLGGGYVSHFFKTQDTGEAIWDDPRILIYAGRISAARDLILGNGTGFLEKALQIGDQRPVVIIAEGVDGEALHALVMNRVQAGLKILAVKLPFSPNKGELLEDIGILTGGKVFSREAGHKLHKIDLDDLGSAARVIANDKKTLILRGKGDPEKIQERVTLLRERAEKTNSQQKRKSLKERAAKLKAGIAIIRIGGASEVEYKERHDRIEDALFATQAAAEDGIVPGGGVALLRCSDSVSTFVASVEGDERLGAGIILKALKSPLSQIAENAGLSGDVVVERVLLGTGDFGFNARTEEYCNLTEAGIVDPAKVVKAALTNAASVAGLVLTTEVILSETKKTEAPPRT